LFDGKQREDYEKRAAALSELKRNMDAAADKIQGQNAQRAKRSKAIEVKRAAEKSEILAAGGNPKSKKKAQKNAKSKMKAQENALLKQIMEEDEKRRVRLIEEERAKE
ncbi:hypothetical protein T484DRAFT_1809087, partial [Baffinella frigidus]